MDTNYETIKSLVDLLVKKAGFDVEENYVEEELEKTRGYIFEFESELKEPNNSDVKNDIEKVINNLKKREEHWQENPEMLGKSILNAYKSNKKYSEIKETLDKLVSLALRDTVNTNNSTLMSYVYDSIKTLEEKKESIEEAIKSGDYSDNNSKQIDEETINYLNNKIIEYEAELKHINSELERFRSIETRDINTITSIKVYINNTEDNLERLDNVKKETLDKEITSETWAKLEKATIGIKKKYNNAVKTLKRFESLLEDLRKNKEDCLKRKSDVETEITKCRDLIETVNVKIKSENYKDYVNKALDENKNAVIKTSLNELKKKKEVIYVDVNQVKKEIIKEWSKIDSEAKNDEVIEEIKKEKNEPKKEEKKKEEREPKKIEFDW